MLGSEKKRERNEDVRVHPSHEHPTNDTRNLTKKNTHTHTLCTVHWNTHTHREIKNEYVKFTKLGRKRRTRQSNSHTHRKDVPIVEMAGQIQNELIWILIKNQLAQHKKKKNVETKNFEFFCRSCCCCCAGQRSMLDWRDSRRWER